MKRLHDIRGVIFDMDGTITLPVLDFALMRARLGIPEGDMLATIRSWSREKQEWAFSVVDLLEEDARRQLKLQPGAEALMQALDAKRIPKAILTRNTEKTVRHLQGVLRTHFSVIVTRDFPTFKPDPAPALHICREWNLDPGRVLLVGDYRDDMLCGKRAGTLTCLLLNERNRAFAALADITVNSLEELVTGF
jgi:HAD superfamily hydrolase (TIGR01509 family)